MQKVIFQLGLYRTVIIAHALRLEQRV